MRIIISFFFASICALVFIGQPALSAGNNDPYVWKVSGKIWLRDPNIFRTAKNKYILSGTTRHIIEYASISNGSMVPSSGKAYVLSIASPDNKRRLRKSGFFDWQKTFFNSDDGLLMIASLPTVSNFNENNSSGAGKRSVYVFEPVAGGKETKSGFPLDWKLKSNRPLLHSIYNGDIFKNRRGKLFIHTDVRQDRRSKTTCILAQTLSASLKLGPAYVLLCPGKSVPTDKDWSGWDRDHPFASEVRRADGGGLVEGAWTFASGGKFYVLYSSGDYKNKDLYGGFLAACSSPLGPCSKALNAKGNDTRVFLKGSSGKFHRVGRPYPVIDAKGKLIDIIFHARRRGTEKDDIMRCTNFTPTMLQDFMVGGAGCEYDDVKF